MLFVFILTFFVSYGSVLAEESKKKLYVHEVCKCYFPSTSGQFQYLKVDRSYYTLLYQLPIMTYVMHVTSPAGYTYRIASVVASTKLSSVGWRGPVYQILKWNGPWYPSDVIYSLDIETLTKIYLKMIE